MRGPQLDPSIPAATLASVSARLRPHAVSEREQITGHLTGVLHKHALWITQNATSQGA